MARILVVDDDEMFRDIYEDILVDEGHEVILAENGELGVVAALSNVPDLILMDLNMPGMTGFEAIRCLRAEEPTKNTPILAVTAENATANYEEIYEAGANGYLGKPINGEVLIARINSLFSQ